MNNAESGMAKLIDMHFHVGLIGDQYPRWGKMSAWYRRQLVYKMFLFYTRIKESRVSDKTLREETEKIIDSSIVDHVVCLALDPVYDNDGNRREERSHMWVDNEYVLDLRRTLGKKVLLGASVHPYDLDFKKRVNQYVEQGAVFIKWLPSSQHICLSDDRVKEALKYLATAKNNKPLPLLLHVGPEYAIPSSDTRTTSYDFLSWNWRDKLWNSFRGKNKWYQPQVKKIQENLKAGLEEGAVIIFAHCGLPYFIPKFLKGVTGHSEFKTVKRYVEKYPPNSNFERRCYTDISACVTPFRKSYHSSIRTLPSDAVLFGSDLPTPVFELSANRKEMAQDLKEIFKGHFDRIIVPQDNLLDVNYRELLHAFPGHAMFKNFNSLL